GVRVDARLAHHVADEGRRPRRIDDRGAEGGFAQDFALLRIGDLVGELEQLVGAGAQYLGAVVLLGRGGGIAVAAHLELVGRAVVEYGAPVFHHVPPAEVAEAGAAAAVVLLVLRLGEAEAEDAAVRIDAVAVEAGELVDRRLGDAPAEVAHRLRG